MKHFSIHSIAIGIGIGMVIAGIINILFINDSMNDIQSINNDPFVKIIKQNETTNDSEKSHIDGIDNNIIEESNIDNSDEMKNVDSNKAYKEVYIRKGMTSEEIAQLLEEKEIILSRDEFIYVANNLQMTGRLKYGLKRIPNESSIEDILEILVEIN
ncbi:hypothetical protein SAMN05446037_1001264 [Anaerovirgula multivorans]|uniref:YceG-like family protein n=1 Tax=Anaerovirgula multivorans TaxID=312168 RepID=A0A239A1H2_9FIRM|nr:hypothetical protein [Anaerovirgula multivorans]SNR89242.1 hypothetical protein SAMN05446037_1001264 [Anaerovirgula multivorans]